MALTGIEIFKILPKTNCKECGCPTCMAFGMKVAQGAMQIEACPHVGDEVKAKLAEATAPPMKTIKIGTGANEHTLGGETVLFRHEKTFVSRNIFAVTVCAGKEDAENDKVLEDLAKIDYDRIGEREFVETVYVNYAGDADKFVALTEKALKADRALILACDDPEAAKKALAVAKDSKPILLGANAANADAMCAVAKEFDVVLGVTGASMDEIYDTIVKLEGLGNKNLVVDTTGATIKETFANTVLLRRNALKDNDRSCGYPSIVNLGKLAAGDEYLQSALASVFTLKYGSIIVMESMAYSQALALYGLRQNVYTDPQKPMRVTPGIYPINGADENAICAVTVDFALSYFVISGEMERSGVPINLIVVDAGGYSVLTSWAAGKFSAGSISKYFEEAGIADKIKNRNLVIPGKVAVLKGELEDKLAGWNILVGPNEAMQAVKFFKELN
ncbi:MAG: acetyl-CoA decarbonylase/synthase complex subunit gamma [Eubacteriaceae bacterium]|nr:acetyl-CoA decarbonylase/synthase complex subunit gamma [Eubacteriaceae bacterium]